jgi:serine protease Do
VQDVTPGSLGARAGVRVYDLVIAVDGKPVLNNDALIQDIAIRQPGSTTTLQILRDGRPMNIVVKLAERPGRDERRAVNDQPAPLPSSQRGLQLGMSVRELDEAALRRYRMPEGTRGVLISRVEPMSPAFDADVERGHILLEVNRQSVETLADYRRLTGGARAGDVLALYVYKPELEQRAIHTVKIE